MAVTDKTLARALVRRIRQPGGAEMRLPSGAPPLPTPERQRRAAEKAKPASRSHGVVTGVRIVLWLGSFPRPCDAGRVARGLKLDPKHVRESLNLLADLGLIQSHEELRPGVRPVRVYSLLGGFDVVPVLSTGDGSGEPNR